MQQRKYEYEQIFELYRYPAEPMKPVIVSTGPGDFLDTVQKMGSYAWVDIWKTINMLEISGLSESRSQSYDLVYNAEWPFFPRIRTAAQDRERIVAIEKRLAEIEEELKWPDLTDHQIAVRERAKRDGAKEIETLSEILSSEDKIERECKPLQAQVESSEGQFAVEVLGDQMIASIPRQRSPFLSDRLKSSVFRGNCYLSKHLKNRDSLDQATDLAFACQRYGVADNLEHFFACEDDRMAFMLEYATDEALENARKRNRMAIGSHAERLKLEIFDSQPIREG